MNASARRRTTAAWFWGLALCAAATAASAAEPATAPAAPPRVIVAPPESLHADKFYAKYIDCGGLPLLGSKNVSDYALKEAAYLIDQMLANRPDIRAAMAKAGTRIIVQAYTEFTTDIPAFADLKPKNYWDRRARGLGACPDLPVGSGAEENLLGYPGDPYAGENIFIHEFAHGIHEVGLNNFDKEFQKKLETCFAHAKEKGLWERTYAMTNEKEYWAEGVQSYFDCNQSKDRSHNGINTRDLLEKYDPDFYKLIAETFGSPAWRYVPPARRSAPGHLAGYDPAKAPTFTWPARLARSGSTTRRAATAPASQPAPAAGGAR